MTKIYNFKSKHQLPQFGCCAINNMTIRHKKRGILMKKYVLTAFFIFALAATAQAAAVRDLNLEDLCSSAGKIFWGVCTGVEKKDAELVYTFKANRFLKGGPADTVTLRMHRLASMYARAPKFTKGQEVLLFLHPESKLGYSSPVGFGQGVFMVSKSGAETTAGNERNNRLLFKGMNMEHLCPGTTFSGIKHCSMTGAGSLRHQELMDFIEKLVEKQ